MNIDREFLMDYQAACKMLPHVKPRTVTNILIGLLESITSKIDFLNYTDDMPEPTIKYCGMTLSARDIYNIRDTPDYGRIKIMPQGAKTLIALYQAGGLFSESDRKAKVEQVNEALISYSKSEEELIRKTTAKKDAVIKARNEYKELMKNPENISVRDFTYSLLNDVFWANLGKCSGVQHLTIGGVSVVKSVQPYRSNSGKSRDFEVSFEFTDESGERKTITKNSVFAGNRLNDPERNHGLPNSRAYQ